MAAQIPRAQGFDMFDRPVDRLVSEDLFLPNISFTNFALYIWLKGTVLW